MTTAEKSIIDGILVDAYHLRVRLETDASSATSAYAKDRALQSAEIVTGIIAQIRAMCKGDAK